MPSKTLQQLQQTDHYIKNANTGAPADFSKKLRISERQVHRYISLLKKLGASIEFCSKRKTYYYTKEGGFSFRFEEITHPDTLQ